MTSWVLTLLPLGAKLRYNEGVSPRLDSSFFCTYNLSVAGKARRISQARKLLVSLARLGYTPGFVVPKGNIMWTIYALVDPRTSQIRYVGQTQNHPEIRLDGHLHKKDDNKAKRAWIDELRRLSLKPVAVVLEYVPTLREALIAETEWIRRGKESGWQLLNWGNVRVIRRKPRFVKVKAVPVITKRGTIPGSPATVNDWHKWTLDNYLPAHPELLQLDTRGRGMGIKALSEAMATENGKDAEAMKGTASEVAKRLREECRLPGGAPLGTDVSIGGS